MLNGIRRLGSIIKSFIDSDGASGAGNQGFKFNPTFLVIGGVLAISFVMLLLLPLYAIGNTTNLSIMQALIPGNDSSDDISQSDDIVGGKILLIAGHSYKPYCDQASNECREEDYPYVEPTETRKLVKLIKKELDALQVENDIANELLGGNDEKMNKSFYVESVNNTPKFNSIDWSKYAYVLEVHFNASDGQTSGPLLVKTSGGYSTEADKGIIEAVTKNTGTAQGKDVIRDLNNMSYFQNLNIPMTYLETEYYDNKKAMDVYSSKKEKIAKDIAKVIKDTYGTVSASGERAKIVARAKAEMGKPYVWGATGPDSYDCSGFVGYALTGSHERLGTTLTFWNWPETKNPQPGDVAVIDDGNGNGHTGLYIGNGQMIHAPQQGDVVKIGPVQAGMKYVVYPDLKEDTSNSSTSSRSSGGHLTPSGGVFDGPSGKETYYNLDMSGVVSNAKAAGVKGDYWVRDDGCKMLGNYIMVAANQDVHPYKSIVKTSLGDGIVVDTGGFASYEPRTIDIAVTW